LLHDVFKLHPFTFKPHSFILYGWIKFHLSLSFSLSFSIYDIFLIHSSVVGHLGCFYNLAIGNSATIDIGVQVSLLDFDLNSFGYIPRSGIARLYSSSIFRLSRCLYTIFHSGCTNLHSHQKYMMISFSPYTHDCLCFWWYPLYQEWGGIFLF
jgi:hypothetical protein